MTKYRKKPIVINAEPFKLGMEDGFKNSIESMGEGIRGVQNVKMPYIKTLEGEYPVQEGKHMIVTGVRGEQEKAGGFKWMYKEDYDKMTEEDLLHEEYMDKYYPRAT